MNGLEAKAIAMVRKGRWDATALDLNLQILAGDACNVSALCRAGRCYRELGLFEDAIGMYARAEECAGESSMSAKIARIIAELTTEAGQAENRGLADRKRREWLDRVSDPHEMIRAGGKMRDEERLDLAEMMHLRAVKAAVDDPTRVHALEALAADLRQRNRPKWAGEAAVHALRLDGNPETNMPAYTILIASLCDLDRNTQAADLAEKVLTVSPNDYYLREAARRAFREAAKDLELSDPQQEAQARLLAIARQATFFADSSMTRELGKLVDRAARLIGAGSLDAFVSGLDKP
jgi:tetratricopeptide (TPR) repeat protein